MRDALGPAVMQRISDEATAATSGSGEGAAAGAEAAAGEGAAAGADAAAGDAGQSSLARALLHADTVWIGFRPAERFELTDNVVALRGRFAEFEPSAGAERWAAPQDLGGDWRRRERQVKGALAAPARFEPRRLYLRGNDVLVFVSKAELHSVARQVERGEGDPRVTPPERGVFAFAGRLGLGAPPGERPLISKYPELSRLLQDADAISGFIDLEAGKARLELDVSYVDTSAAQAGHDHAQRLLKALGQLDRAATWLRGLRVARVESHLVLRVELPLPVLGALLFAEGSGKAPEKLEPPSAPPEPSAPSGAQPTPKPED